MSTFTFRNISIRDKLIMIQFIVALLSIIICTLIFFFSALNTFKQSQDKNVESLANVNLICPTPAICWETYVWSLIL